MTKLQRARRARFRKKQQQNTPSSSTGFYKDLSNLLVLSNLFCALSSSKTTPQNQQMIEETPPSENELRPTLEDYNDHGEFSKDPELAKLRDDRIQDLNFKPAICISEEIDF